MSLKLLDDRVRSFIRSGVAVSCISQCVEELVLNSIDAGAQCVTVRVDVSKLFIQVTDNGTGVSFDDLQLLGERYATSKCHTLSDLNDLCFHGYRGEAVASVINCCGIVEFTSRHCLSSNAYCKIFHHGRSLGVCSSRSGYSSIGTTVTVQDIFYNLPVRKKVICDGAECDKVCRMLAAIALIHPSVSFTLRNSQTSERLMQTRKTNSILGNFEQLFGTRLSIGLQEVSLEKHGFKVFGYISTNSHYTKSYQFVYLNKRHIKHTKIHSCINHLLSNSLVARRPSRHVSPKTGLDSRKRFTSVDSYGVFVLNIECLLNEFDITLEPAKTLVEFKRWDDVLSVVESVVTDFLARNNLMLGVSLLADEESPEGVSTSSSSRVVPQDVTYGLRSKAVQRMAPFEPIGDATNPTQAKLSNSSISEQDLSPVTISACVSEGEESNIHPSVVSHSQVGSLQSCKKRKIAVDENAGQRDNGSLFVGKDPMHQCVDNTLRMIQLDTPVRSPLNPISIASKLKGMNSGQRRTTRTLLSAAKHYGNRNKLRVVGIGNTGRDENQVVNQQPGRNESSFEECEPSDKLLMGIGENQAKTQDIDVEPTPRAVGERDSLSSATMKDMHCTPSGRTVATTYSFITPLSRDCHTTTKHKDSTDILCLHSCNTSFRHLPGTVPNVIRAICPLSKKLSSSSKQFCGDFSTASCSNIIHNSTVSNVASLQCVTAAESVNTEGSGVSLAEECEVISSDANTVKDLDVPVTSSDIRNPSSHHQLPPSILSKENSNVSIIGSGTIAASTGSSTEPSITMEKDDSSMMIAELPPSAVLSKGSGVASAVGLGPVTGGSMIVSEPLLHVENGSSTAASAERSNNALLSKENTFGSGIIDNSVITSFPMEKGAVSNHCTTNFTSAGICAHSPLRAAPHLTYGFTPLKPRAKDVRRPVDEGEVSLSTNVYLPASKWRDSAHCVPSSILSDWENPALSSGDSDVMDIGLSSERSSSIKIHSIIHPYKFTNDVFNSIEVLGQVDCKFIACLLKADYDNIKTTANRLLIFFDQHAVHERVRLEELTKGAYNSSGKIISVDVHPPQAISLSEAEMKLALIYREQLEAAGVALSSNGDKVLVHSMPSVFSERDISERRKGRPTVAMELVQELVSKQLDLLCSTKGVCTVIPVTIQHVLSSQACHGAIKFGDPLTIAECTELIQSLSSCKLPFQCAHGRPSVIPILDLELLERRFPNAAATTVNIEKLKMLQAKKL